MAEARDLARIQQRMNAIPKAVKLAIRPAMERAADDIVDLAKSLVPVSDPNGGTLRDSIGWTWGVAPSGTITLASSTAGELTITIYAGSDEAFYARFVEFGTQSGVFGQRVGNPGAAVRQSKRKGRKSYRTHPGTPAQPFFFPAYRLGKKKASMKIKRAISKAVKENWGKK
ncbi:MAG: HK97 gp10 family phage protein [Proteobacteria bacterium]|nr:HK97 gp10 family phage protein [Pseudomonadota bacterium]